MVIRVLIFALLVGAVICDDAYVVEKITIDSVDIYYPVSFDSDDNNLLLSGAKFPGVIIALGANIDKSQYSDVAMKVASNGYIVAVPTAVFFPFFNLRAATPQLLDSTRSFLIMQASDSASPIYSRLENDNFHLLGHSLGGTLAIVTGSKNAQFICTNSTLAFFCAGYSGDGSSYRSVAAFGTTFISGPPPFIKANNSAAVALILGATDARVSNVSVTTTYSLLLDAPKIFITVDGVNHLGITDSQVIPGQVNNGEQDKSQGWSTSMIGKASVVVFNAYGKNSSSAYNKLYVTKSLGPKALTVISSQA